MNVQPSDGDLDGAGFAQDAATAALCHRRARLRFHGFDITLTLTRDSRPVAQETVFIPHA